MSGVVSVLLGTVRHYWGYLIMAEFTASLVVYLYLANDFVTQPAFTFSHGLFAAPLVICCLMQWHVYHNFQDVMPR